MIKKSLAGQPIAEEEKKEDQLKCSHYWIIDVPDGVTSMGVCKLCKEKREFINHMFYSPWEEDTKPLTGLEGTLNS